MLPTIKGVLCDHGISRVISNTHSFSCESLAYDLGVFVNEQVFYGIVVALPHSRLGKRPTPD
jgi:hypothetical protein